MDYRERWELKDYLVGERLGRRIRWLHWLVAIMSLGYVLDFWYIQAVRGEEYASLAENNRLRRLAVLPTRGVIYDRGGEVLAATRSSLDLVLRPEATGAVRLQVSRLAPILRTTPDELERQLNEARARSPYQPIVLREDVALEELAQIEARRERFPGVEVLETARRNYPQGSLVAHVMGYVGEVGEGQLEAGGEGLVAGDIVGKSGVERVYDPILRGRRGWNLVTVNNLGRRMSQAWVAREPAHGTSLDLTLDMRMQRALYEALGAEAGAGVFLDPWTGRVLAMVSTPAFDPNAFADGMSAEEWKALIEDPRRPLHDRAIASFYAPGSTFKILMALAALDSGTVRPGETVTCTGATTVYGRTRQCWKRGGHGTVNLRSALAHSCNVYFYQLGKRMGIETIHEYGTRFGLGTLTGIDLPGETEGVLPSTEWKRRNFDEPWYPGDTVSVAIGQGFLAVTPIQLVRMVSAVATGGRLPRPYVCASNVTEPKVIELDAQALALVRQGMTDAVEFGTGRASGIEGIAVAGKTGTAQLSRLSVGVEPDSLPKEQRDHGWFLGFAPADAPQVAFVVVVEHGGGGGRAAAPVAQAVLRVFFGRQEPDPATQVERRDGDDADVRTAAAG